MTVEEWLGEENKLGQDIWDRKYRFENETFDEWVDRVSGGNEDYKRLIFEKKFLPGGRILANRGLTDKGVKTTYSNCYVIPQPLDNLESIFDTAKLMARTYSYGGGCGIDISKLSPRGAKVNNTAKQTSGSTSFMDLYSTVTGLIGQNGRRGALMISLACDHPDVEEFIELKSNLDKVTFANISVRVTNKFMEAVKGDKDFKLSFTREETGEVIEKTIKAKELFNKLCYQNWDYAEPGMLFWDRITSWNLLSNNTEFEYAGVNPCAEEPLPAGGSCLLGSINLSEFVEYNKKGKAQFNKKEFENTVKTSVRFLNEILDEGLTLHPLEIQRQTVGDWRQIGLGIMGLADALIKLGIIYGSKEAVKFSDEIGFIMANAAILESSVLAKELGTYNKYDKRVLDTPFFIANTTDETKELVKQYGLRNSQLLTIAPTGTLSSLIGISGGIESIFANFYTRTTKSLKGHDEDYKIYTPIVKEYMENNNITDDKLLPPYFVTSADLKPIERVGMQAAWQRHIDASISSTVNLPEEATVDDVKDIYLNAYEQGLKGITIFRSGCKRTAILNTTDKKENKKETDKNNPNLEWGTVLKVNSDLVGMKTKITNGCGHFHLQLFYDETTGRPWETFISLGDGGGCERNLEIISKLISKSLRAGVPIDKIIETLKSVKSCNSYCNRTSKVGDTSKGTSCPSAIGFALESFIKKIRKQIPITNELGNVKTEDEVNKTITKNNTAKCPECGAELVNEGGCNTCKECGYSKCG